MKFNIGDKVIPIDKSIGCSLNESIFWLRAIQNNQKYLYVIGNVLDSYLECSDFISEHRGGLFKDSDLVLYSKKILEDE